MQKLEEAVDEDRGDMSEAAGSMLTSIYCPNGVPLHAEEVAAKLKQMLHVRGIIIRQLAERNASYGQWAAEEWVGWYERNDLPRHDMDFAYELWKTYFEDTAMHTAKRQELEQYRSQGTRTSKEKAREVFRRAFRAW